MQKCTQVKPVYCDGCVLGMFAISEISDITEIFILKNNHLINEIKLKICERTKKAKKLKKYIFV